LDGARGFFFQTDDLLRLRFGILEFGIPDTPLDAGLFEASCD